MMNFAGDSTYNTLHKSNQDQDYLEKYLDKKQNVYLYQRIALKLTI